MALTVLGKTWYDPNQINQVIVPNVSLINSRYDNKTQFINNNGDNIIRNLRETDLKVKSSETDTIHIITPAEEYRPDIVALQYYNNVSLSWVILSANDMKSVLDFTINKSIVIPSVDSIYSQGGVMSNE
jgi:hypothetical protein